VRTEILEKHPQARLSILVVWFSMLPGDGRGAVDLRLLGDSRVTNFWDEGQAVGRWFASKMPASRGQELRPISWDVYLLYGSGATWESVPGPLVRMGRPVIADRVRLGRAIQPLLGP
jgi:hypothetical protein